MKRFNTTGTCFPDRHYMVDISERIAVIQGMIEEGDYFCINRGRQYGKTTTLQAIKDTLDSDYCVLSISFEGLGESSFVTDEALAYSFVDILTFKMMWDKHKDDTIYELLQNAKSQHTSQELSLKELSMLISNVCAASPKPVILLIDEVDQSGNYTSFIQFLGMLRQKFLDRLNVPTFQSVILAGVYDIKNLKLKLRPDDEHQYNSPWNIAVPFDEDMSLHAEGIAGMLKDYQGEHDVSFDENLVADEIYAYTSGYPFLVSRLCQIIDKRKYSWDRQGVIDAVHDILNEHNTLFDDLMKKLDQFPELRKLLRVILFSGERKTFSSLEKYLQLAEMFSFIRNDHGSVRISNRILETCLYNLFSTESEVESIYTEGGIDKNQFIVDGMLNMRHLIERFSVHFNDIYGGQGDVFKEKEGRRLFLLYLRPVINGVGNYYVEAETRDETRTDIVVDYLGHQYVIELKIWRGDSYNGRGEKQLAEYLDYFHLDTGYLVSFCFNRSKSSGVREVTVGERKVFEAVV